MVIQPFSDSQNSQFKDNFLLITRDEFICGYIFLTYKNS